MNVEIDSGSTQTNGKFTVYWTSSAGVREHTRYATTFGTQSVLGCFSSHLYNIFSQNETPAKVDSYGRSQVVPMPNFEPTKELEDNLYQYIIKNLSGTFVVMGDAMNRGTTHKKDYGTFPNQFFWDTTKFVEYLIREKIGTIYAGPIGRNANHSTYGNFSLCQIWIWVRPQAQGMVIPGSASIFNEGKVTRANWAAESSLRMNSYYPLDGSRKELSWDDLVQCTMRKESPLFSSCLEKRE